MKTFKSISDVDRIRNEPVHATIEKLVAVFAEQTPYRPADDGYLVLIGPDAVDRDLNDLDMPYRLSEVPFEGVTVVDGHFHSVYISNNQFALSFLIPDANWLPGEVRRHLEAHLDP